MATQVGRGGKIIGTPWVLSAFDETLIKLSRADMGTGPISLIEELGQNPEVTLFGSADHSLDSRLRRKVAHD